MGVECGCHSGGDAEGKGDEGEGVECDGGKGGEGRAVVRGGAGRASCVVGEARGDDGDGLCGLAEELSQEVTGEHGPRHRDYCTLHKGAD